MPGKNKPANSMPEKNKPANYTQSKNKPANSIPGKNKPTNNRKGGVNKRKDSENIFAKWTGQHLWTLTIALFLLSFAVRLIYSFWCGPVVQIAYPDEIRLFDIARSLVEQGQILVRGLPTSFQKILYPVFITPAFLFTNNQISQMNIIRVINCLLVSSTLFPAVMLAKKLTENKTVALITLFVTITLPDMAYSATLLSEALYMPLVIWLFYFTFCAVVEHKQSKRLAYFLALGMIAYLVYLTKEIGAAFIIAAILLLIVDGIRDRHRCAKQNALSALALSTSFFGVFFVLKLTLFKGLGNTYDTAVYSQTSLSAISSPAVFFFFIYSSIVLFVAAILSFYVAPVFFALYGYSSMNDENRKIYLFTIFSLITMVGAIAYTISIREDFGELIPRLHMRYIAPLVIPLMIQCFDSLFKKSDTKPGKFFLCAYSVIIMIFCAACIILIPHGPEAGYLLDHYTMRSIYAAETFSIYFGSVAVNIVFLFLKLFLVALTLCGAYLFIKKKKLWPVIVILLCTVLFENAYDNHMSYTTIRRAKTADFSAAYSSYSSDAVDSSGSSDFSGAADSSDSTGSSDSSDFAGSSDSADFAAGPASIFERPISKEALRFSYNIVDALISINDHVKTLDGTVIVFMPPEFASYADTYLDSKTFPIQAGRFYSLAVQGGGSVRMDAQPIKEGNRYNSAVLDLDTWKRGIFTAGYIITIADDHPFVNVMTEYENRPFTILRNLDPSTIYIEME